MSKCVCVRVSLCLCLCCCACVCVLVCPGGCVRTCAAAEAGRPFGAPRPHALCGWCPTIVFNPKIPGNQNEALKNACSVQVVSKLHQILKPFLLRRVKTDVETSLPGKMEVRPVLVCRGVGVVAGAQLRQPPACLPTATMPQPPNRNTPLFQQPALHPSIPHNLPLSAAGLPVWGHDGKRPPPPQPTPTPLSRLLQVILYAGMTDRQRELNQQLRDKTLNVRDTGAGRLGTGSWLGRR